MAKGKTIADAPPMNKAMVDFLLGSGTSAFEETPPPIKSRVSYGKVLADIQRYKEIKEGLSRLALQKKKRVYFLLSRKTGLIKIGTSKELESRVERLSKDNQEKLVILGAMDGSYQEEKALHLRFAEFNVRGEWFAPDEAILSFIKQSCNVRTYTNDNQTRP